ncbi:MAG: hypothetical protein HYU29_05475 [Chloroflexi bacterium]|nr:hypothetical protein [Chloroflexota bacterium]
MVLRLLTWVRAALEIARRFFTRPRVALVAALGLFIAVAYFSGRLCTPEALQIQYRTPTPSPAATPRRTPTSAPLAVIPTPSPTTARPPAPTPASLPGGTPTPIDTRVAQALSATGLTVGVPGRVEGAIKLETLSPLSAQGRRFSVHADSAEFSGILNDILYIGYNVTGAGDREDDTYHSLYLAFEARYREPTGGDYTEFNLDFVDPLGAASRPMSLRVATDGGYSDWRFRSNYFSVERPAQSIRLFAIDADNRTVQVYPGNLEATAQAQWPSLALKLVGMGWDTASRASAPRAMTLQTTTGAGPGDEVPHSMSVQNNEGTEIASFDGNSGSLRVSGGVTVGPETAARPLGTLFRKALNPGGQPYQAGQTTVSTFKPAQGFNSIEPQTWAIPPSAGGVQPCLLLLWSDGSTTERCNASETSPLRERFDDVALTLSATLDGLWVKEMAFTVKNVQGSTSPVDLGEFQFAGWQY